MPDVMKIMKDIFISSESWIKARAQYAVKLRMTHVIIEKRFSTRELESMFEVYTIEDTHKNSYHLAPEIMDLLRAAALVKGRVLFVEGEE